ncbi:MAG: hypothetical protein RL685_3206 [Pseudomonadota bacterium]
MLRQFEHEPLASALLAAIREGDVEGLAQLLGAEPHASLLFLQRPASSQQPAYAYPLLAAATDWPGHYPRVAETIRTLVAAGADVNAHAEGPHQETALHGAASSSDLVALDALLDAGADIEASGAVIAGGTALDDAVAFAQWSAARRLVERGAQMAVWHAAALGRVELLAGYFAAGEPSAKYPWGASRPSAAVHIALWCACHAGQRAAAEWLLARGADPSWIAPWDGLTPLATARRNGHAELVEWLESYGGPATT